MARTALWFKDHATFCDWLQQHPHVRVMTEASHLPPLEKPESLQRVAGDILVWLGIWSAVLLLIAFAALQLFGLKGVAL